MRKENNIYTSTNNSHQHIETHCEEFFRMINSRLKLLLIVPTEMSHPESSAHCIAWSDSNSFMTPLLVIRTDRYHFSFSQKHELSTSFVNLTYCTTLVQHRTHCQTLWEQVQYIGLVHNSHVIISSSRYRRQFLIENCDKNGQMCPCLLSRIHYYCSIERSGSDIETDHISLHAKTGWSVERSVIEYRPFLSVNFIKAFVGINAVRCSCITIVVPMPVSRESCKSFLEPLISHLSWKSEQGPS